MKKLVTITITAILLCSCSQKSGSEGRIGFVTIQDHDLIQPNGECL